MKSGTRPGGEAGGQAWLRIVGSFETSDRIERTTADGWAAAMIDPSDDQGGSMTAVSTDIRRRRRVQPGTKVGVDFAYRDKAVDHHHAILERFTLLIRAITVLSGQLRIEGKDRAGTATTITYDYVRNAGWVAKR